MSDEDIDGSGAASASRRSNNVDRRTPRFSWNYAYEATFFRSLCESMQMGYKENHSFKAGAWERAAIALRDKHQAFPEKSHLINKADNARKKFRMWRGLREDPEFLYNPNTRMVTASEEAWRRHFEKEPLSKALRGRPFDHEEYMEILFPDVVGSGGAPKRIMKKRKNPDGTPVAESSGSGSASGGSQQQQQQLMDLTLDNGSTYAQSAAQASAPPPAAQAAKAPIPAMAAAAPQQQPPQQQQQRPTSTTIPPRTSIASSSALTPPDEQVPGQGTPNARKRFLPPDAPAASQPSSEKRRGRPSRFSTNFYGTNPPGSIAVTPSGPSATSAQAAGGAPSSSLTAATGAAAAPPAVSSPAALFDSGLQSIAEALLLRSTPRWPEQAVEILFAEFADEEPDLQLKIAEKALTDDNKAMVFVKMTPVLRKHWVGRLREVHQRNLGGGLGLGMGGRVGEDTG